MPRPSDAHRTFDLREVLEARDYVSAIARYIEQAEGIEDYGEYDEEHEAEIRGMITQLAYYAESGDTYDPNGRYLCGSCSMRLPPDRCTHVRGRVSMAEGGCQIYVRGEPIGEGAALIAKLPQALVNYEERPVGKGFGCYPRCRWGEIAKRPDSAGRVAWCKLWGLHVEPTACCFAQDADDAVRQPGEIAQ
jgi:hypothetical protein